MITSFKDLEVYQRSYKAALMIHEITLKFPEYERYELASQIRRATKSIPLNIGEGYGKKNSADEFKRFLQMSIGSCDEVKILIEFANDLGYIAEKEYLVLIDEYEQIGKMLYVLHKNWQKK